MSASSCGDCALASDTYSLQAIRELRDLKREVRELPGQLVTRLARAA